LTFAIAVALCASGCTGKGGSSSAEATTSPAADALASASPAAAESAAAESPAAESPAAESGSTSGQFTPPPNSTAAPVPSPTPDPNLLSVSNGTILRSYSPAALDGMNDGNLGNAAKGIGSELPDSAKPPYVFTFELASTATISQFGADLRNPADKGTTPSVTFAVSTSGPDSGFSDVGTITDSAKPLGVNVKARWVRVTANQLYNSVEATGSLPPPPAALKPVGIYVEQPMPDKNGQFVASGAREGMERVRFVMVGTALVGTECTSDHIRGTFIGHLSGRSWAADFPGNKDANPTAVWGTVNDDASIIATAQRGGEPVYFTRTTEQPAFCYSRPSGTGARRVLVLDQDPIESFFPVDAQPAVPGYRFEAIGAGMLDGDALAGKDAVVTRGTCKLLDLVSAEQRDLLLDWVASGHKLILGNGPCSTSAYAWLPYAFTAAAGAETTNSSLIQIENNALGSNDKNDAVNFVDAFGFAKSPNNGLSSAEVFTYADSHWCGHLFVAKPTNVNGFAQTYAVDGKGLIIYDGFTEDDNPVLHRIRGLELGLPAGAGLPCTQHADEAFIFEPNQEGTFVAGKVRTFDAKLQVLANQGWSGPVKVTATGALPATASPNGFNLAGGVLPIDLAIRIPATAKAGLYSVTATAANGGGKSAQATITLTGTAPLSKQIAPTQKRIRIYGIHFDVDSAVIQPRSEPVIAEIAQLMKANPGLRFQVEGHTDSDGGAAYNLALSQRRAQAVVNDLVTRYGIARSRLVAKGFGLSKPVASNATEAGKALNRRVELLRL
jgi:outer membrane protein OmpA-like peptidoglycan-associated protein